MVKKVFRGFKEETGEYPATTFPIEEGMYGSEMTSDLQEFLLSKCTLFVSNKWDRVPKEEVQDVKDASISKLKQIWPGFDPKSQLIFISAKYATVALRQLKIVTEEFDSLMNGMEGLITNSINARLECSWRWLYDMLSQMIAQTESFLETISSKLENVEDEIKKVNCALEYIENHREETMEGIRSRFLTFEDEASKRVREYFSSADVKARFARWTKEEVPQEGSDWEKTKRSIEEAFYSRLQEMLQHWLKDDMLLERAEEFLHEELKKYFDVPKDQLKCPLGVPGDSSKMNIGVRYRMAENSSYEGLMMGGTFAFLTGIAWLFNPIASLAIRVGVAAVPATLSALGLSVEGMERLEARSVKGEFQNSKEAFMSKHSKLFLDFVKDMPENFVKLQLKPVKQQLFKAGTNLSTLIPAKREQLARFENEERSLEEVKNAHARISEEGCRLRGHHVVGVTEMCPMIQISREALKWKEGFSSPIGRGTFGDIYEAEMTKDGKSKTVALEVYRIELNDKNAREIVDEIEILRKLQGHSHIVQFHGVSFREKDVAFIFEKCTGSLADYIFRDKKTLVSTESTKHSAIPEKFQWAREIIDGLVFMHAQNVVHSNLKPENILLSEENVIKIAHVGLAKPVDVITETVAGTYSYTAPEVIDSKEYDRKSDIYSLGIILWEIWYGQRAYECWHGTVQEFFAWLKDGNRPGDKSSNEPPWKQLMMQCWDGNPKTRPPAWACKNEIKRVESF